MPIAPSFREVLRPTHELGRKVDEDPPASPPAQAWVYSRVDEA